MAAGAGAGSLWNKNSWHWEEKKYTTWAHGWLREKLTAINVEKSGASARVTKIAQLTGDAAVNVRKGKKHLMFEFNIKLDWEGKQGDDATTGYCSMVEVQPDDVRDEDFEITVRANSGSAPAAKEAMRTAGVTAIRAVMTEFLAALAVKDGDDRALAEDKARRAEEARKAEEAEKQGAAAFAAASAEVEAEEAKRKEEEAKKAAAAPKRVDAAADKPDGQGSVWNANNYHWEEKPLHSWARDRLKALLEGWELEIPGCSMRVVTVESCLGEASISIRKGKKLCFFELSVKATWEGEIVDDEGDVTASTDGEITFEGMDQDNYNDDLEIQIACSGQATQEQRIYENMRKHGLVSLKELLAGFVAELVARG